MGREMADRFCPMLAQALIEHRREENEPMWFCQQDRCAWWSPAYNVCAEEDV